MSAFEAFRMFAAVELDNQAPFTTNPLPNAARGVAFPLTLGEKFLSAPEKRPLIALILLYISVLVIILGASAAAEFRSA